MRIGRVMTMNRPVWKLYAIVTQDLPTGNIAPLELCSALPLDYLQSGVPCDSARYCCLVLVPCSSPLRVSDLFDSVLAAYRPMAYTHVTHVWEVDK